MRTNALIDTNILIYAYDRSEPEKQRQALFLLKRLRQLQRGLLSSQVISEFCSVVTRKISTPLTPAEAARAVESYLVSWRVLSVTGPMVLEAARGASERSLHFWDALLWATARFNQVPLILSEDFSHGAVLGGVSFANPFSDGFRLEQWLG